MKKIALSFISFLLIATMVGTASASYQGVTKKRVKAYYDKYRTYYATTIPKNTIVKVVNIALDQSAGRNIAKVYAGKNRFLYVYDENGEYGYVDASYIDWDGIGSINLKNDYDNAKDLSNYEYRQVIEKGRGPLIFQKSPRGSFMSNFKYHDGDWIYVNLYWREDGYAIAYESETYGYVDASYIDW